jgi:hypothetical protein
MNPHAMSDTTDVRGDRLTDSQPAVRCEKALTTDPAANSTAPSKTACGPTRQSEPITAGPWIDVNGRITVSVPRP